MSRLNIMGVKSIIFLLTLSLMTVNVSAGEDATMLARHCLL